MALAIVKPGLLTTVQDLGRSGYQQYGVSVGGAMDPYSLRTANLLVGNPQGAAALEITVAGPQLTLLRAGLIAVCGGDLGACIDGRPLPLRRPVYVPEGATLAFGHAAAAGCRAYLAAAGGIAVAPALGGGGTDMAARIGGHQGRALQAGDVLQLGAAPPRAERLMRALAQARARDAAAGRREGGATFQAAAWGLGLHPLPDGSGERVMRVVRGREYDAFTEESRQRLLSEPFAITPDSNRMGYRLRGESPLVRSVQKELLSSAVTVGTVQVPPDGNPIVLMADRQTVGGYPRIAQIIQVDIPIVAQAMPGDRLRFREISAAEAQELYMLREMELTLLEQTLKFGDAQLERTL